MCLLTGIGLTQLSAQNSNANPNATGTYSVQFWFSSTYWSPVYCGDQMVDFLEGGEIIVHRIGHRVEGKLLWRIEQIRGEVTSVTGEVFTIRELDKTDAIEMAITWKYNLHGSWGNHYLGILTQNLLTGEITVGPTICN